MAAKDKYHDAVVVALEKEGWTISKQNFQILFDSTDGYINLMAERPLIAERGEEKIAVEIKTFAGRSVMTDLQKAIGQFLIYQVSFSISDTDRRVVLAVPADSADIFERPMASKLCKRIGMTVMVYDYETEEIIEWIITN